MKVAVALIFNDKQQILISRRAQHQPHGGCWEFPGGKLEPLETAEQALCREVFEETGLIVNHCSYFSEIHHQYPKHHVELIIYTVKDFSGEPRCLENQTEMRWVDVNQLSDFNFPEANLKIIERVLVEC